ncbi:MAG: hypothetical protein VX670_10610, partial [Candidatus Latescibacterota bacterium]|nr:hypothetical protein [Candidatus Latescibacterota bacterium]
REIFEFVHQALVNTPYYNHLSAGIVLTGGGAMLDQIAPLAEEVLGHHVRVGAPQDMVAPDTLSDPSYATAIGLLRFAADEHGEIGETHHRLERPGRGFMHTIGKLLSLF